MAAKFAPYVKGSLMSWNGTSPSDHGWSPQDTFRAHEYVEDPARPGGYRYVESQGYWKENLPFEATLTYHEWEKGRSAMRIIWKDEQGHTFPMFMKDADLILSGKHSGEIVPGVALTVKGTWIVVKRGANYGIALVDA